MATAGRSLSYYPPLSPYLPRDSSPAGRQLCRRLQARHHPVHGGGGAFQLCVGRGPLQSLRGSRRRRCLRLQSLLSVAHLSARRFGRDAGPGRGAPGMPRHLPNDEGARVAHLSRNQPHRRPADPDYPLSTFLFAPFLLGFAGVALATAARTEASDGCFGILIGAAFTGALACHVSIGCQSGGSGWPPYFRFSLLSKRFFWPISSPWRKSLISAGLAPLRNGYPAVTFSFCAACARHSV